MASSPPTSPPERSRRPTSGMVRQARSSSRLSTASKQGGSRASDDDSRTSVKVAIRIRPPLKPSDPGFDLIPQRFQNARVQITSSTGLAVDSPQGRKLFVFDRVFGEDVQQDGIWDYISDSVESFAQGYNVSVMAYGQSGAGKSFTMGTAGSYEQGNKQLMGVIPRAATSLFEKLTGPPAVGRTTSGLKTPSRSSMGSTPNLRNLPRVPSTGKQWRLKATYLEIYNEQLRDLLLPENTPLDQRNNVTIREDAKGRILLTGLTQIDIDCVDDLLRALTFGSAIRQTDATAINAKSSRSHAVFSLNLVQRKSRSPDVSAERRLSVTSETVGAGDNSITVDSKLHFVDLAGSERLKNTGASGDRAKEGIAINAGLASLGKVISQLSSRQAGSHVSYRDSKLTRLLQDSLGGNAITYMIACVTPAEFHLSETLNTVQYAQRARAIQSKPQIQQLADDGEKNAVIDRLRTEVSFLREQIRNSERSERQLLPQERAERQKEREMELQNHILDLQESYSALSKRHANMISELAEAREHYFEESSMADGVAGRSVEERVKRSNTFAEAAKHVISEYEKTIQSLETSLANNRTSLSATESSLLERESKCASTEAVNQQLQTRLQKIMDRESNMESYVRDIEARLDGRHSGEEKSSAQVTELRKEMGRLRESEASSEEYISNLEEKLAEADQDMELMNREIARLEQVVERQRSVGKLDNLLHELDRVHASGKPLNGDSEALADGAYPETLPRVGESGMSSAGLKIAIDTPIPEADEDELPRKGEHPPSDLTVSSDAAAYVQSPERAHFVEDKLDTVNQELFDLRVEHESTLTEYELLSAKYEEALRTLAAMQDAVEEAQLTGGTTGGAFSPTYFLADARVNELKHAGQQSSSRSLSSELSSAGESPLMESPEIGAENYVDPGHTPSTSMSSQAHPTYDPERDDTSKSSNSALIRELEGLKELHSSREQSMIDLESQYAQLKAEHDSTLYLVEELKAEAHRAKLIAPPSPTNQFIRRKSSNITLSNDRAHRAMAYLGKIAEKHLAETPDVKESYDVQISAIMHELHQRSERVEVLESELVNVRKEMEAKMTIISGLTRERSSLKVPTQIDVSILASVQDQIIESERQLQAQQESSAIREKHLLEEIGLLRESLDSCPQTSSSEPRTKDELPGTYPVTPAPETGTEKQLSGHGAADQVSARIRELQKEVSDWQTKHSTAEKHFLQTIAELESTIGAVEELRRAKSAELDAQANSISAAAAAFELERARHGDTVTSLKQEMKQYRAIIDEVNASHAELKQSYVAAQREAEESKIFKTATIQHLDARREQIATVEQQLKEQRDAVELYKQDLKSLHETHARNLEDARSSALKEAEAEVEKRIADMRSQHTSEVDKLNSAMAELRIRIQEIESQHAIEIADLQGKAKEFESHSRSASVIGDKFKAAQLNLKRAEDAKIGAEISLSEAQAKVEELTSAESELKGELTKLREKEGRASRLVEELEGQLSSTYEDGRKKDNRLSTMENTQSTRDHELEEARATAVEARATHVALQEELTVLRRRLEQTDAKRASTNTQNEGRMSPGRMSPERSAEGTNSVTAVRKSAALGLPSPPPAIPLPPLPIAASPAHSPMSNSFPKDERPKSPLPIQSKKDAVLMQRMEEQEARVRTVEKHLFAEKQLTATLEEALVDLETQSKRKEAEADSWKKQARTFEEELTTLRKERNTNRQSLQAVEEERGRRKEAEAARAHLEERMAQLSKKKKKNALNCF